MTTTGPARDRDALVTLANQVDESGGLDRRWLSSAWMHLGLASQLRAGDRRTVELLTRAVDCGIDDPGNFAARQAAGHLALHYAAQGEPERAAHWLRQEARFGGAGGLDPSVGRTSGDRCAGTGTTRSTGCPRRRSRNG
ncbi:hypothetical protein P9209_10965 [Prescottella defluvii]|nr:hypothetical protein P9209_10965 [Prescottella defluvii]